jgi:hypothetical protein
MSASRKAAFAGGAFYVLTFLVSIPALPLLDPVLSNPSFILGSGSETSVLWGCFFDLINALAGVGSAVALYPVVKRYGQSLALGIVTTRIFEMAVIMIGVISLLAVVTLRQDGASGADSESLVIAGRSLVAVRDWTFLVGPGFICGINAVLLGTLMYRSRLVPRWIPLTGLVGAPFFIAASITTTLLAGSAEVSVWSAVATAPIFVWELALGIYLMVKGFRPNDVTAEIDTA